MKKLKLIVCLFFGIMSMSHSQNITVLNKGDVFDPPQDQMVVMDKYTFGNYHYTAQKYDTLKNEVLELDSLIQSKDSTQAKIIAEYVQALELKDYEANVYKEGYGDIIVQLNSSIDKNNQLITDYKKLQEKNKRIKRWRNFFLGGTIVSAGILILLVAI